MNHIQELTTYVKYMAKSSLFEYFSPKAIWATILWIFGFLFGMQMNLILECMVALMVMDMLTGMIKAARNDQPIESRKALRSALKLAVYALLVASTHLVEVVLPGATHLDDGMVMFLSITELISILENVGRMGYPVPQLLLQRLLSFSWAKPATPDDLSKL